MKNINDDIEFDDIDFSKYKRQIEEIQKDYDILMSNPRFMRKFNKFKKKYENNKIKNIYDVTYNNTSENIEKFDKLEKKAVIEKKCYNNSYSSKYSPSLFS